MSIFANNSQDELADKAIKLTARERRFIKFASVEYDGQIYMTPQDFLESVVEQEPRRKWQKCGTFLIWSKLKFETNFAFSPIETQIAFAFRSAAIEG